MQPDDKMLLYVRQLRKWTGVVSVTSSYFEDRTPIWNIGTRGENYPYRIKIKPEIVLREEDYIDALLLAPRMEYVKRWLPESWPLAFFDTLHLIPQRDFSLIEGEMKRLITNNGRRHSRRMSECKTSATAVEPVGSQSNAERSDDSDCADD
jgi:predicted RNA-binding protein